MRDSANLRSSPSNGKKILGHILAVEGVSVQQSLVLPTKNPMEGRPCNKFMRVYEIVRFRAHKRLTLTGLSVICTIALRRYHEENWDYPF